MMMKSLFGVVGVVGVVLVAVVFVTDSASAKEFYSVFVNDDGTFKAEPITDDLFQGPFAANEPVRAEYDRLFLQQGWDRLNIVSNPEANNDKVVASSAGYIEGQLTAGHIYNHSVNTGVYNNSLNPKLQTFLEENNKWMKAQIAAAKQHPDDHEDATYWFHIDLILTQLEGICSGYNSTETAKRHPMSCFDILRLNLDGDMEDLEGLFGILPPVKNGDEASLRASHCSALVKLLPENEDIFISQDTWSSFNSMLRIMKRYDLSYHVTSNTDSATVPGRVVSFSSYPGVIFSGDDFYVLSSGLVVMETTIGNSNPALNKYITSSTVLEWARNIIANRLANDGPIWNQVYSRYNSGTYNNQNFVLNYNLFTPGKPLQANTLLMVEQIPGTIIASDVSQRLQDTGYFGSYNTAYNSTIRSLSGADNNTVKYGTWFDYEKTARALIFKRNHTFVTDMDSMQALMRYNNYKVDPLSTQLNTCAYLNIKNCTPAYTTENTIACRGDLNPKNGVYSLSAFGQRNHVATDSKISSFSTFNRDSVPIRAISGPTNDQVPVFQFSTSPYRNISHLGMPDRWDFPWVTIEWE